MIIAFIFGVFVGAVGGFVTFAVLAANKDS